MPTVPEYPQEDWMLSLGRENGSRQQFQRLALDIQRRGQPDIGGWAAEAEKLAGGGLVARGGQSRAEVIRGAGGVSPDTIAEQKAQLTALVNQQWNYALVDWRKVNKWAKDRNWTAVLDLDPTDRARAVTELTASNVPNILERAGRLTGQDLSKVEDLRKELDKAPGTTYFQKLTNTFTEMVRQKKMKGVPMIDPNGNYHEIPLNLEE